MDHLPQAYDFNVPQPISTDIALYGGIFAKRHVIPLAGSFVPQHSHGYDHLSILASGGMRVWCDGALMGEYTAPAEIRIPAHAKHTLQTLADNTTFYCVHNEDLFEVEEQNELPGRLRDVGRPKDDGIVFTKEKLDDVLAEDSALFYEHCASIGDAPDAWKDRNWALIKRLETMGAVHLIVARRNGELLGYLMSIVSPSLEQLHRTEGLHSAFYTSKTVPGLGLRLQRASIEYLKSIGVDMVVLRARNRGVGPRLSAIYRRLGAAPWGTVFTLDVGGT